MLGLRLAEANFLIFFSPFSSPTCILSILVLLCPYTLIKLKNLIFFNQGAMCASSSINMGHNFPDLEAPTSFFTLTPHSA